MTGRESDKAGKGGQYIWKMQGPESRIDETMGIKSVSLKQNGSWSESER